MPDIYWESANGGLIGVRDMKVVLFDRLISEVERGFFIQSFESLRKECEEANKRPGNYPKLLRDKIKAVWSTIYARDPFGNIRFENIPFETKAKMKDVIWKRLAIDENKNKASFWESIFG